MVFGLRGGDLGLNDGRGLWGIRESLLSTITGMRLRDLSVLEVEVLARLVGVRRTTAELVEEIYGTASTDEGYRADYYRVRRATRSLEEKGFISAPLFGRDKPFHLTRYAVSVLTGIGVDKDSKREGVLGWKDGFLLGLTLVIASLSVVYAQSTLSWTLFLPGLMLFLSGISVCKLSMVARSVL